MGLYAWKQDLCGSFFLGLLYKRWLMWLGGNNVTRAAQKFFRFPIMRTLLFIVNRAVRAYLVQPLEGHRAILSPAFR